MTAPYRVEMLGGLRVRHQDRLITRFHTPKTGELLAYLACNRGRTHPREHLIESFFPDLEPAAARNNLSQHLGFLRRQFEHPPFPAGSVFVADRLSVAINPENVTTDLALFEAALDEASRALSERTAIQHLTDALTLYEGPLLPECYADWAISERERLAQRRLQALRSLVRLLAKTGEISRALSMAVQAVEADPLLEEAHRDVMRLYLASGQPAAAVRQYRKLEQSLAKELGIAPSAPTRQLLAQVQTQIAGSEAPRSEARLPSEQALPAQDPAEPQRRRNLSRSPMVTPPPMSGTMTLLLLDFADPEGGADRGLSEVIGDEALTRLRAEVRRHGGGEIRSPRSLLVCTFGRASDAGRCALAIRDLFTPSGGVSHPLPSEERALPPPQDRQGLDAPRVALDTREIRLKDGEEPAHVLDWAMRLLGAAHAGQIVCGEATASLLRREPEERFEIEELGRYRLQEHEGAQRVFGLQDREALRSFPPLQAPSGDRVSLPPTLTRFFGREAEMERLADLLEEPDVRLVTLLGPGGTGKTRLAREAAARYADTPGRGVWWADVTEVTDPSRLADALVTALGLSRSPNRSALDQVVDAVSAQQTLLVLDNFEQLVEAGGVEVVGQLLSGALTLTLMVTSRQALEFSAERRVDISPLPVPEGTSHDLLSFPSIALFVDRVQAVRPDFLLGAHNAEDVRALCIRLEGIPLAIEIAAGRAQMLSVGRMLAELEDRFAFLVSRKRDLPSRHRTLRAALDWSYRLLSPELQHFFTRLSVFRGGWEAEAAAEVCQEAGDVLEALETLHNHSLVAVEEHASGMRFRMLETVREYAAEQLAANEERDSVSHRHLAYYRNLARDSYAQLEGSEGARWLDRLEREHDNLRAALDLCMDEPIGGRQARENPASLSPLTNDEILAFVVSLRKFWQYRAYYTEGRHYLGMALARPDAQGPTELRARVLNAYGALAFLHGDYAIARTYLQESLEIAQRFGNKRLISADLETLSNIASGQDDYQTAVDYCTQSLSLVRELRDQEGIGKTLCTLSLYHMQLRNYEQAHAYAEEGLAISREIGNRLGVAYSLYSLGTIASRQGDYDSMEIYYQESMTIWRELGDKRLIATILSAQGWLARQQGDYVRARTYTEEALLMQRELGSKGSVAHALGSLGGIVCLQGDLPAAESYLHECLQLCRELGAKSTMIHALETYYLLARARKQPERAVRLFAAALNLYPEMGISLSAEERAKYDPNFTELRELLGEEAYNASLAAGLALTLEQAVADALEAS